MKKQRVWWTPWRWVQLVKSRSAASVREFPLRTDVLTPQRRLYQTQNHRTQRQVWPFTPRNSEGLRLSFKRLHVEVRGDCLTEGGIYCVRSKKGCGGTSVFESVSLPLTIFAHFSSAKNTRSFRSFCSPLYTWKGDNCLKGLFIFCCKSDSCHKSANSSGKQARR